MKKFLVIYNAPAEAMAQMAQATPEQKAEGMKPWMAWKEKLGDKLVDLGNPLMPGQRLTSSADPAASGTEITGYSILQAENADEARALMEGHPHFGWHEGVSVDVHECIDM